MTYTTKCNGHCIDRIDTQAETIKAHKEHIRELKIRLKAAEDRLTNTTKALITSSKEIVKLRNEKADLTQALNRTSYNPREDANWDSRPRVEVQE